MRIFRPPAPPAPPPPYTQVGPYILAERLAVGGMAEVFRASDSRPGHEPRTVVVKRMLPALATEARARAMFEEEARLGALVEHPNVVRALGFGTEGGQPYLVLEYVPGVDLWRLSRWLTKHGRKMDVELVVFVLRELLAGLHAVHEARDRQGNPIGLVHRDVSPSNVLLSTGGEVKLGDFGIAHARLREAYPQVALGEHARGKLGYLAPEQVCGQPVDRRTDVFAAAVIGAELFMGQPLFRGSSELAVLLAIRDAQVRPFVEYARSLPRGLGLAILAALARSPDDRTPTALALRDELEPFQGGDPVGLRAQLAALVQETYADRKSAGVMPAPDEPATPLAHTEQTPAAHSELTAEAHTERTPGAHSEPTAKAHIETPAATVTGNPSTDIHEGVTGEAPELVCFVRTSQGQTIGPLSYAKVVEAIATGHFGIADTFAVGGGPFRPLQDHPDLFRHVPASSAQRAHDAPRHTGRARSPRVARERRPHRLARPVGARSRNRLVALRARRSPQGGVFEPWYAGVRDVESRQ